MLNVYLYEALLNPKNDSDRHCGNCMRQWKPLSKVPLQSHGSKPVWAIMAKFNGRWFLIPGFIPMSPDFSSTWVVSKLILLLQIVII